MTAQSSTLRMSYGTWSRFAQERRWLRVKRAAAATLLSSTTCGKVMECRPWFLLWAKAAMASIWIKAHNEHFAFVLRRRSKTLIAMSALRRWLMWQKQRKVKILCGELREGSRVLRLELAEMKDEREAVRLVNRVSKAVAETVCGIQALCLKAVAEADVLKKANVRLLEDLETEQHQHHDARMSLARTERDIYRLRVALDEQTRLCEEVSSRLYEKDSQLTELELELGMGSSRPRDGSSGEKLQRVQELFEQLSVHYSLLEDSTYESSEGMQYDSEAVSSFGNIAMRVFAEIRLTMSSDCS